MTINKTKIITASLIATIVLAAGLYILNLATNKSTSPSSKPQITQVDAGCSPDKCISQTRDKIYAYVGINDEQECSEIKGFPVFYYNIAGTKTFYACATHQIDN
ncbi:MAG: hypothetical protein WA087_04055 [Candidatus Saccharimonadales bacterium]